MLELFGSFVCLLLPILAATNKQNQQNLKKQIQNTGLHEFLVCILHSIQIQAFPHQPLREVSQVLLYFKCERKFRIWTVLKTMLPLQSSPAKTSAKPFSNAAEKWKKRVQTDKYLLYSHYESLLGEKKELPPSFWLLLLQQCFPPVTWELSLKRVDQMCFSPLGKFSMQMKSAPWEFVFH